MSPYSLGRTVIDVSSLIDHFVVVFSTQYERILHELDTYSDCGFLTETNVKEIDEVLARPALNVNVAVEAVMLMTQFAPVALQEELALNII